MFIVVQFVFSIIHGSERVVKNEEGLGTFTTGMTSGGSKVYVRGRSPHSNNMLKFRFECSTARQDLRRSQDQEYSAAFTQK